MQAIILAGGRGERLSPISDIFPKPLLPINNKPILGTLLEALHLAGIHEVAIVVGHLGRMIRAFAGSGERFGLRLNYYEQQEQIGNGHAALQAADFIEGEVMVLASDTPFTQDHIEGMIHFHEQQHCDVSLCLKRLPPKYMAHSGMVHRGENGRVLSVIEKPDREDVVGNLAVVSMHIYPPSLPEYLTQLTPSPRGEFELTQAINLMIRDGMLVKGKDFGEIPHLTDLTDLILLNFPYLHELTKEGDLTRP